MQSLVFLENAQSEPYTTHHIIAEFAGIRAETVSRLLREHRDSLESFGKVGFEIRALEGSKTGQQVKIYHLNEQQATLLMTFFRNTPTVIAFKKELVRQFFLMRSELAARRQLRQEGKPKRRELTDAIRDSGEMERMKGHAYSAYTNLTYKVALGVSASKLRKERGADRTECAANYLTAEELKLIQKKEAAITVLLDAGLTYDGIKAALLPDQ